MNLERLQRLRGLLDEALTAPDDQRGALLARVMSEDVALGGELARLIEIAATDDGRFEPLVARATPRFPELAAGTELDPWRLARPLGRGGMGDVWLAERADGAYAQRVAVKSPRSGVQGPRALQRLEREPGSWRRSSTPASRAWSNAGRRRRGAHCWRWSTLNALPGWRDLQPWHFSSHCNWCPVCLKRPIGSGGLRNVAERAG